MIDYRPRLYTAIFVVTVAALFGVALWTGSITNELIDRMWASIALGGVLFGCLVHLVVVVRSCDRERRVVLWLLEFDERIAQDKDAGTTRKMIYQALRELGYKAPPPRLNERDFPKRGSGSSRRRAV